MEMKKSRESERSAGCVNLASSFHRAPLALPVAQSPHLNAPHRTLVIRAFRRSGGRLYGKPAPRWSALARMVWRGMRALAAVLNVGSFARLCECCAVPWCDSHERAADPLARFLLPCPKDVPNLEGPNRFNGEQSLHSLQLGCVVLMTPPTQKANTNTNRDRQRQTCLVYESEEEEEEEEEPRERFDIEQSGDHESPKACELQLLGLY